MWTHRLELSSFLRARGSLNFPRCHATLSLLVYRKCMRLPAYGHMIRINVSSAGDICWEYRTGWEMRAGFSGTPWDCFPSVSFFAFHWTDVKLSQCFLQACVFPIRVLSWIYKHTSRHRFFARPPSLPAVFVYLSPFLVGSSSPPGAFKLIWSLLSFSWSISSMTLELLLWEGKNKQGRNIIDHW